MSQRLTLQRGQWYGWTMWPGYADREYHSPIYVAGLQPLGHRTFELEFLNLGYAAGVQMMHYTLQTLRREARYLLAAVVESERSVAITPLELAWFEAHLPAEHREILRLAGEAGGPAAAIERWLAQHTRVHLKEQ